MDAHGEWQLSARPARPHDDDSGAARLNTTAAASCARPPLQGRDKDVFVRRGTAGAVARPQRTGCADAAPPLCSTMASTRFRVTLLLAVATRPQAAGDHDHRAACQSQHSLRVEHHHAVRGAEHCCRCRRNVECTCAPLLHMPWWSARSPSASGAAKPAETLLVALVIMSNHGSADLQRQQINAWTSLAQRVLWRYRVSSLERGRPCRHSTCATPLDETTFVNIRCETYHSFKHALAATVAIPARVVFQASAIPIAAAFGTCPSYSRRGTAAPRVCSARGRSMANSTRRG